MDKKNGTGYDEILKILKNGGNPSRDKNVNSQNKEGIKTAQFGLKTVNDGIVTPNNDRIKRIND